jgi:hypothetical protein
VVAGTRAVLSRLRDRVRRTKERKAGGGERVSGAVDRCVSCRVREGVHDLERLRPDDPPGYLCAACHRRWERGRWRSNRKSFDDVVGSFQESFRGPGAGSAGGPRVRYLGLLYLDGNGLGAAFGRLRSLAELRVLSEAVTRVFERLELRAKERVRRLGRTGVVDDDLPLLTYLGGGDEAIWIAPGALAVDLAARAAGWVEEEAEARPELANLLAAAGLPRHLTVAVGLVLCDRGYPVRYQRDLAGDLQKGVKRLYAQGSEPVSGVDFELVTDAYPRGELKVARRSAYGTDEEGFVRTCRPYTADGFATLVEAARSARRHEVATSQLHALQTGAREGEAVFLNFLRYQLARAASRKEFAAWLADRGVDVRERAAVDEFFVHARATSAAGGGEPTGPPVRGTWISDLVELAPFIHLADCLEKEAARHAAA